MFERYIICPQSLRNISEKNAVTGFAFDVRLAYYRGLALSMVEGFEVKIDGAEIPPTSLTFQVAGERFTFAELESEAEARWEFTEAGTVHVAKPGGLTSGAHDVAVVEILRISYMPEPARRVDSKRLILQ
jgi:hypothetical protein